MADKRGTQPPPFSIRFTFEERAALDLAAAGQPLAVYVRSRLFDDSLPPRRTRGKQPVKDHVALAALLSELGEARIANNLNQLARAANSGSLPVTPETEQALADACADIRWMRDCLMNGLGLSTGVAR